MQFSSLCEMLRRSGPKRPLGLARVLTIFVEFPMATTLFLIFTALGMACAALVLNLSGIPLLLAGGALAVLCVGLVLAEIRDQTL